MKGLQVGSRRTSQKGKVRSLQAVYCELRKKNSALWRKVPLSSQDAQVLVSIDSAWQAYSREHCLHRLLLSSQIWRHPDWSTENPVPSGINVTKEHFRNMTSEHRFREHCAFHCILAEASGTYLQRPFTFFPAVWTWFKIGWQMFSLPTISYLSELLLIWIIHWFNCFILKIRFPSM